MIHSILILYLITFFLFTTTKIYPYNKKYKELNLSKIVSALPRTPIDNRILKLLGTSYIQLYPILINY